jgi:hypothetical protein
LTVAASDEFRKQEIDDVTDLNDFIAAASKSVAFMGKVLIAGARVLSDFEIDQIDKKKIPLIKNPRSFHYTLLQINEYSYEAFVKAHENMFGIQLNTGKMPRCVADCIEYLKSGDKKGMKYLLQSSLDEIKQTADDGATISKEVCDAFDLLGQLIGQVIEALMTSLDVKRKEITDEIGDETTRKQQENIYQLQQKKLEAAEENVKEKRKDLDDIGKSKLGIWLSFFRHEPTEESLESAREMLEDAENKLKKIREKVQNEIEIISNENIESWKHVRVDVDKALDHNEMLQILNDGLNYLGQYHDKWLDIHRYFIQMSNDLTKALLTDFSAETVEGHKAIEELENFLQVTSDVCAKMYHSTIMHAQAFDKYILKGIFEIQPMLYIPSGEIEEAQMRWQLSWEEASNGIKDMYEKDAIREIEKQNSSTGKCQ